MLIFELRDSGDYLRGTGLANEDLTRIPLTTVALSLENADIDDDGIVGMPTLRALRVLDLDGTKITDRSLAAIARLPVLEELWLECTEVTDAGLEQLHTMQSLRFVSLAYTRTTQEGIASLVQAIPGVEVSE